jgi:hypothetical protein
MTDATADPFALHHALYGFIREVARSSVGWSIPA